MVGERASNLVAAPYDSAGNVWSSGPPTASEIARGRKLGCFASFGPACEFWASDMSFGPTWEYWATSLDSWGTTHRVLSHLVAG